MSRGCYQVRHVAIVVFGLFSGCSVVCPYQVYGKITPRGAEHSAGAQALAGVLEDALKPFGFVASKGPSDTPYADEVFYRLGAGEPFPRHRIDVVFDPKTLTIALTDHGPGGEEFDKALTTAIQTGLATLDERGEFRRATAREQAGCALP